MLKNILKYLEDICDGAQSKKQELNETWKAMGNGKFERTKSEQLNKIFRRSIYFVKDLNAGEVINRTHIRRIRPGFALDPKNFEDLFGKKVKKNVKFGDRVTWDLISK